jgi:soluble lytic murein transglycosylase-like protein
MFPLKISLISLVLLFVFAVPAAAVADDMVLDPAKQIVQSEHLSLWIPAAYQGDLTKAPPVSITLQMRKSQSALQKPQTKVYRTLPESTYEDLFERYGGQFNVPVPTLKKIAYCESGYNPGSLSRNHTYAGMFQFSASTWTSTRNAMGLDPNPELRLDAEQAILTAAYKIAAGGIHAWPTCSTR